MPAARFTAADRSGSPYSWPTPCRPVAVGRVRPSTAARRAAVERDRYTGASTAATIAEASASRRARRRAAGGEVVGPGRRRLEEARRSGSRLTGSTGVEPRRPGGPVGAEGHGGLGALGGVVVVGVDEPPGGGRPRRGSRSIVQ